MTTPLERVTAKATALLLRDLIARQEADHAMALATNPELRDRGVDMIDPAEEARWMLTVLEEAAGT